MRAAHVKLLTRAGLCGGSLTLAAFGHAQVKGGEGGRGDESAPLLAPIVVSATRTRQPSADLPLSIDRLGVDVIQQDNLMVDLSEPLARVPGIVVRNRQNYAQDLQISSRGFGARSTFGVRGVRLYVDGIPATMPDGQGQTSNIDLASASSIEVLRGPFSALYGNSSGGVISVFTENGKPGLHLEPFAEFGSFDSGHIGLKASGQQGPVNYVLSASRFHTDGYRRHSAARRDTENAKLRVTPDADSAITIIGNAVDMPDVQDPLGLTREHLQSDPRGVEQNALTYNTRKSVRQQQLGVHYERLFGAGNAFHATLYGGHRSIRQFLSIPPFAQAAPTSAGGVIDLRRNYDGLDLRWTHDARWSGGPLKWSAGLAYDNLDEDRRGYENFVGATVGVQGRLRRNESNRVYNLDQYLQAQWEPSTRWLVLAGVRHSAVRVYSDDHYVAPGNGNDSGSIDYHAVTPVLGATLRLTTATNLYASYGRGFETPTLNELSYRSADAAGSGFNFGLQPARSDHVEAGVKSALGKRWHGNLALFDIRTEDEITVLSSSGGRAVYQNAGSTRRRGVELEVEGKWRGGWSALLSYSHLHAVYDEGFCPAGCTLDTRVAGGSRIPGIPADTLFAELDWKHAGGFSGGLEGRYVGKAYVNDLDSDAAAAYFIANLHGGFRQQRGPWHFHEFARVDNLADRQYVGSVIVNEGNQRYFEPAPGRTYLAGISARYSW